MGINRNKETGQFTRTHKLWTPEKWNDGYLDNKNRFRVYRPDYPRAYHEGYALRAHVVWWLHHGRCHARNKELHHKDGSTTNDVITNLIPLSYSTHRKFHRPKQYSVLICMNCRKPFRVASYRIRSRPTKFCTQQCYQQYPKSDSTRYKMGQSQRLAYKEGRRISYF